MISETLGFQGSWFNWFTPASSRSFGGFGIGLGWLSGREVMIAANGWETLHEEEFCGSCGVVGMNVIVDCLAASMRLARSGEAFVVLGRDLMLRTASPKFCLNV